MNNNKPIIVILLSLLAFNITAFKSENNTDASQNNFAVISLDKMNILYIGLINPISVSVPGEKSKDITINCSEGLLGRKTSDGHYILEVTNKKSEVYITVFVKGKQIGSLRYRVKSVPKPILLYGQIDDGKATIEEVLAQDALYAGLDANFAFDGMKYAISKYSFTFYPNSRRHNDADGIINDSITFNETGGLISPRIKKYIRNAKPGDEIVVSNIEAYAPGLAGLVRFRANINILVE